MARTLESGPSELRPLMLSWLWLPERSRTDGKKARVRAVRSASGFDNRSALAVWKREAEGGDGAHPPEDAVAAAAHGEELTRHGLGEGRGQVGRLTELAALDEEAAANNSRASIRQSDHHRQHNSELERRRRACAPAEAIVEASAAQAHVLRRVDSHRPAASSDAELVDATRHLGQRCDDLLAVVAHAGVEDEAELAPAQLKRRRPPANDTIVSIRRAANQWPSTAQSAQD